MVMDIPVEELDNYIEQINNGQKIIYISSNKELFPFLLKFPGSKERLISQYIYKRTLIEAERLGLPSIEETKSLARKRGFFTSKDEAEIVRLETQLKGQKAVLEKTTRVPANRERLVKVISDINNKIYKIKVKEELILENSRERKAIEEKLFYLTYCSLYDLFSNNKYWKSYEEFREEKDFEFIRAVYSEFVSFYLGLPQDIIRYIARSNLWRFRYLTAVKISADLFDRPVKEYTPDQASLVYWSHFYQSIYEMLPDDRPPESIIEDDAALDAYMSSWQADKERDAVASRAKKQNKYGQKSAWDYNETLVFKSNPMAEDIEYSKPPATELVNKNAKIIDAAPLSRSKNKR